MKDLDVEALFEYLGDIVSKLEKIRCCVMDVEEKIKKLKPTSTLSEEMPGSCINVIGKKHSG